MRIIIAGATGLVGGIALKHLAEKPAVRSITTISRRPISKAGSKHSPIVAPTKEWPSLIALATYDVGVCCLGTTIRAAGSREAFAAVDFAAVQAFAKACRTAGARQLILVSSVGADSEARNFYLATKGKTEVAVCEVGFDRVDILRPGLLVARRSGPVRIGETIAIAISPLTDLLTPNVLSRYRSTPAEMIGRAIADCTGMAGAGVFEHHNDEMRAIRSDMD